MEVLFVCSGNAARSQMAEAMYNQLIESDGALSAGTEAIVGKPIPDDVISVMKELGIDLSHARRKMIDREMVDNADRIVLMTDKSLPPYLQASSIIETWDVADPRGLGLEAHREARDKIKANIEQLLK